MDFLIKAIVPVLILGTAGGALLVLNNQVMSAKARTEQIEQESVRQQTQLVALKTMMNTHQQLLISLQNKQRQIYTNLSKREQQLEQLIQSNAAVHDWATTALPDDLIRLRQHPTITGADAYIEYLSQSDSLSAVGICPDNELGTAANAGKNRSSMGHVCSTN